MKVLSVEKTTYMVEGGEEPCWVVSNGYTIVRIAPCYHPIGRTTIILTEFLDGDFNSEEEWDMDFDSIDKSSAIKIANRFSVYL
jgi:hypothetical protein